MSRANAFLALGAALLCTSPAAGQQNDREAFEAARKLEQSGKPQEAFLAYAAIPGAQHAAVRIGRPKAAQYLALLREKAADVPLPLAKAVEGDLLLAAGEKAQALACYRAVARSVATSSEQGWASGHLPREGYLAEPPSAQGDFPYRHYPVAPFTIGPGSHRDNLLVRRFIALEAWDAAAGEFARVWQIHRRNTQPFLVNVPVATGPEGPEEPAREKRLVRPIGFDGRGLQFALDYAFFLNKTHQQDCALAVLREPLERIDMDRNPNRIVAIPVPEGEDIGGYPLRGDRPLTGSDAYGWGFASSTWGSAGVSRKEFIRLAYGLFKRAGKEGDLVSALREEIDAGENRLRRVLARVRLHQGKIDEALALELEYIDQGGFDPLSAAYRRGLAYEETGRLAEAVEAYEKALALPYKPPRLPDEDEEAVQKSMMSQRPRFRPDPASAAGRAAFQVGIAARLQRLYGALAKPQKVFETTLRQFEFNPALLASLGALGQAATRADTLGRQQDFADWLRKQIPAVEKPAARANIYWVLKDYAACSTALCEAWKTDKNSAGYAFDGWCKLFRREGTGPLRIFLTTLLQADPTNARARLELLDLENRFEGPDVAAALEALLETDAGFAFAQGKGVYNRTRFRNYFDLAYRLMRLYEQQDQLDKLRRLGLRIAAGEAPFGGWWDLDRSQYQYRDENQLPEDLNACLALVVQHADDPTLAALDRLWKDRADFPARRQLARRRAGTLRAAGDAKDLGWANCPRGVRIIAGDGNVLCLARDRRFIYAGHPWGLAVYDIEGNPVTRIALGEAALALAARDGVVWAGTPKGLFRIEPDGWRVAHLWLHNDIPELSRGPRTSPGLGQYVHDNGVYNLVPDGDDLWIGLFRTIHRLNTRTMTLRAFSRRELKLRSWGAFERILLDGRYVWAAGRSAGLRRYDRATDTWEKVEGGTQAVGLVGLIDGVLYGHVWLGDELRNRPCVIDRDSLAVTPILIEGNLTKEERNINGPFSYFGKYRGKLAFGPRRPAFVLDRRLMKLRPIGAPWDRPDDPIQSILPEDLQRDVLWWTADPLAPRQENSPNLGTFSVRQMDGRTWVLLDSPDGLRIVGRKRSRSPRYTSPSRDWPFRDISWDEMHQVGGVELLSADGTTRRLSAASSTDTIPGEVIFAAVPDPATGNTWLATDLGLAVLDPHDRVLATFTRRDGLCANRVSSGVAIGGRMFFSTAWGDHGGGLAVFDPATGVLTARFQSDGLATDKLAKIEKAGQRLRLVYAVEYGRGGPYRYRLFTPGEYDPATHRVTAAGKPSYLKDGEVNSRILALYGQEREPMPYLGGLLVAKTRIGEKTYLCGTRGLVILDADAAPPLPAAELAARFVFDPDRKLMQEAEATRLQIQTGEDLARYAGHANRYLRLKALSRARSPVGRDPDPFVPVLKKMVADPHPPIRRLVIELLGRSNDRSAVPLLEPALEDKSKNIRREAAMALARLGKPPELARFEEMLANPNIEHNFRQLAIYEVLAPQATRETFELLLKYPLSVHDSEDWQKVFRALAGSLGRHPEAADLLLKAYTRPYDPGPESNYGQARFAREVFRHAGKAMLPRLYEALQSDDRVVRSNAARACGAIGEPDSIPRLIAALELESGLSRASIVWALGTLKAKDALPQLATLYVDARNDEERRRGSGFRASQMASQVQSHYESIADLDAIGTDWNELKALARPEPIDPRRNEPLLEPKTILKAVRAIGPECSQEFYRKLAAEQDDGARAEAAERLAEGAAGDEAKNLPILRNLLADPEMHVRMAAAVSLLVLGQKDIERQILAWLDSPDRWEPRQIALRLDRVEDGNALVFARDRIEKLSKQYWRHSDDAGRLRSLLERIPKE